MCYIKQKANEINHRLLNQRIRRIVGAKIHLFFNIQTKKFKKMEKNPRKSNITVNISTLIGNLIVVTNNESEAPEAVRQKVAEALANIVTSIERHI